MTKPSTTATVVYHPPKTRYAKIPTTSIEPRGIDTEALTTGKCFMICLSDGTVMKPDTWLDTMFTRRNRDKVYVAYNLKYDMGALLQHLDTEHLQELRTTGKTATDTHSYKVITNKMLSIGKGHSRVVIYDIMQYYGGSLDRNAEKYLGEHKIDIETKRFEQDYVDTHWQEIATYCIRDADLTARLAKRLIAQLQEWGMEVRKLYSTAWISYQWFASKCGHPSVKHFWNYDKKVLNYAMKSYSGGKFEVTTKGPGHLYEYDIVSAYPYSISNLIGLFNVGVKWSQRYQDDAVYAFIDCTVHIPLDLPSPVAIKRGTLNTFPAGDVRKVITKQEYDYLTSSGADAIIHDAVWILPNNIEYPYRDEVRRLVEIKQSYKGKDDLAYHTVKILLNSLYGKFIQLVELPDGKWRAGSSWNPIYGSVITAETRVRISNYQRIHPSVWAVHTDSVIASSPLPYESTNELGAMSYEIDGQGIIIGCGVYEIAGRTAIRGVGSHVTLSELAMTDTNKVDVTRQQPITWRQALHRRMDTDVINRWIDANKHLRVDMDRKRIWIDDWTTWKDAGSRVVESAPLIYNEMIYGSY